jgi:hypothetical protein
MRRFSILASVAAASCLAFGEGRLALSQEVTEPDHRSHLLLIVGAAGTDEYGQQFRTWADRWQQAAEKSDVKCTVLGLTAEPATEATGMAQPSDLSRLQEALRAESGTDSREPLWIVFLGHGTFDQKSAKLNLEGPDLSAEQLAESCRDIQRPLAVILCASCSSPFLNALSGPDRVIVTATKDGNEVQYSRFGDAFSTAIGSLEADVDRDSQTSLLEAWLYASRRTAEFYKSEGRLATEHALLDDNGDAKGVRAELFDGLKPAASLKSEDPVDGPKAAKFWFVKSDAERRLTADQQVARDALEARLENLKQRKATMDEAEYLQQLEELLRPLADIYEAAEQQTP